MRKNDSTARWWGSYIAATISLALIVACGGGDGGDQPVVTTTEAGRSTAPAADAAARRGTALVRVIQAIPAAAALDVFADDSKIFRELGYKTTTPYQEVDTELYTFRLRPAGLDTADPLAEDRERVDGGEHYTLVALPGREDEPAGLRVVEDDIQAPASGKTRIRVVHASRDAREVDVHATGRPDPLFDSIGFQTVTRYEEFDPGTATLEVRADNAQDPMLVVRDVAFEAGASYTVVLLGRLRSTPKLEVLIVEDRFGATSGSAP